MASPSVYIISCFKIRVQLNLQIMRFVYKAFSAEFVWSAFLTLNNEIDVFNAIYNRDMALQILRQHME